MQKGVKFGGLIPKGKEAAATIAIIIIIVSENIKNAESDGQGPSSVPAIQCPKIQFFSLVASDVFVHSHCSSERGLYKTKDLFTSAENQL